MRKTTGIERIEGYKKLLPEAEALSEQSGRKEMVALLKKNIRTEEMAIYRKFYFDSGCYFGLLMIQSQVIENQIKNLISGCETFLQKSGQSTESYAYKKDFKKLTLGELIDGPLNHYLKYDSLFILLKDFNKFRKQIIHKLVEDYDVELSALEFEIAQSYLVNDYVKIENKILEASTRINFRVGQLTASNVEIINQLHKIMREISNLEEEDIIFKFDS